MLDRRIPHIDSRDPLRCGTDPGVHVVLWAFYRQSSIDDRARGENDSLWRRVHLIGRDHIGGSAADGIYATERLVDEYGQVLGHHVSEVGAENSHVKATSVADAHHRLLSELVGNAYPRSECAQVAVDVSVQSVRSLACYADYTLGDVGKTSKVLASHHFRGIVFP